MTVLAPTAKFQALDSNGAPLSGGKLYTYVAGTTTNQATYTDQGGGTANSNPIVLDSRGEADVWLDPTLNYKLVLKDSSDVTIWTVDNISQDSADFQFLQAGTGASWRTVQAKLREFVSVEDFGAVGDGATDDLTAIQNAINQVSSVGGGTIFFAASQTYAVSEGFVIQANCHVDLCGSTIEIQYASGADKTGVQLRNYSSIANGTVNVVAAGSPTSNDKSLHCNILVGGDGTTNVGGRKFWSIRNLSLASNKTKGQGGLGILVQADSHDGVIENIDFPTSTTMGLCLEIAFSGNGGTYGTDLITYHPYNIDIRNITVGTMTRYVAGLGDIAVLDIVGAHNVRANNIRVKAWAGDSVVQVRPGGFGPLYASDSASRVAHLSGIHVSDVFCESCDFSGVLVNGNAATPNLNYAARALIERVTCVSAASPTTSGVRVLKTTDTVIRDCEMSGFVNGALIEESTRRIYVQGGRYYSNTNHGVNVAHATSPEDIYIDGVHCYENGSGISNGAGVVVDTSTRVTVSNVICGDDSETNQYYGIWFTSSSANGKIGGRNRFPSVKAGGQKLKLETYVTGTGRLSGGADANIDASATHYLSPIGQSTSDATLANRKVQIGVDILAFNFRVVLSTAPTSGKTYEFALMDDGANSTLEVAIQDAATTGVDYDAVDIAAGSELTIRSTPTSTPTASIPTWSIEFIDAE